MDKQELEKILINADAYLAYFGKHKKLNWFDMSHLLSVLFPEYTKEEILERHFQLYKEAKQ